MSPEHDHEEIEDLLAPFALGAVAPEEEDLIRAHLEGCSSCTATVLRLRRAVGALPLAVEPAAPPLHLRDQILAAAVASRPSARAAGPRTSVLRFRAPRLRMPMVAAGWRPAVAVAAVVAFALGAGLGLGIGRSIVPPSGPASNVSLHTLTGSGAMAGAQGRVFELKQQGLTLIDFSNLPDLEPGKVYELWLIPKQGQPLAAGVFKPDPGGSHVVLLARSLHGLAALAVTTEAGPNGSSAPSQQPQLLGNLG